MSTIKFQLMSDLHLETPKARPTYTHFKINPKCPYLALLGDIGNVSDPRLFTFLEEQLQQFEIVFFLLGNHEFYGTTVSAAQEALKSFSTKIDDLRSQEGSSLGRFVFLNQTRFDLTDGVTVLGCTLFSHISNDQQTSVSLFCADFSEISDWSIDSHNAAHESDLNWLNAQVQNISLKEPDRRIVIFTHHCPTLFEAANDRRHVEDVNGVRSAFVTDLKDEVCWRSGNVRVWGFGHTHFCCDFFEEGTGKRVVANQKGYHRNAVDVFDADKVIEIEG